MGPPHATFECCRCNDKGLCSRCQCVKNNTPCLNCQPLKRGHCWNAPDLTQVTRPTITSNSTPVNSGSSVGTLTNIHSTLVSPTSPLTTSSPPPGTLHTDHVDNNLLSPDRTPADLPHLPPPTSVAEPNFIWGILDASLFRNTVHEAYIEVVHWRKNYFTVPYGQAGKLCCRTCSSLQSIC